MLAKPRAKVTNFFDLFDMQAVREVSTLVQKKSCAKTIMIEN